MSLVENILNKLLKTSIRYKGVQVNAFGIPKIGNYPPNSIKTTIYRLQKRKFLNKHKKGWYLTEAGRKYLIKRENSLQQFKHSFTKEMPKNLIVMFDIPETKKAEREWFRWHLKKFNYLMIQKSVWVGPSPLPKEFLKYIEKIKLKDSIKTFKLARTYNTNKR